MSRFPITQPGNVMQKAPRVGLLTALFILLLSAEPIAAQTKYGQAGMAFLKIDVGVRSAAMAGTYGSVSGDASAMFTNPAGLALVEGFGAMTSINNWIADTKLYGIGLAYNHPVLGTFGVGLVSMDYGDFYATEPYDGTDPVLRNEGFIETGTFSVLEYAIGVSYARQISTRFYVGGQVRYATQDLGSVVIYDEFAGENVSSESRVSNVILDFGTLYYTGFRDLRFGVAFRNFSNQSDYFNQRFELPLTFDFGVAMDVLSLLPSAPADSRLTLALDAIHPRDSEEHVHAALEYGFMDTVFLRGGYKFNYDEQGLTAGLGVQTGLDAIGFRADYAYAAFGPFFGAVHRVALGLSL